MKTTMKIISTTMPLMGLLTLGAFTLKAADCADTTALVDNGSSGAICSSAAFTSGASSVVNGNISAKGGVTLGAGSKSTGSVKAGAAFTSGANSVIEGDVTAVGDIVLGATSRITGTAHSDTGVITYGDGATVGKVLP